MAKRITDRVKVVGLDLGDRFSQACGVDAEGGRVVERKVATTAAGLEKFFKALPPSRVVLEAGTQARWVSDLLTEIGHEVKAVQPRKMRRIYENESKSDVVDARELAEAGLTRWNRLPVARLRESETQAKLNLLKARDQLVHVRTALVNLSRAMLKQEGIAVRKGSAGSFAKRARPQVPDRLQPALAPLLDEIESVTAKVKAMDRRVEEAGACDPAIRSLRQVPGVGAVTSAAFIWTLGDSNRFRKSRQAGAFLGLRPRRDQSGERDAQLPITKAGDSLLRRLLVQCAHYILGPHGPDTMLRRWGQRLSERGGKRAKRKAVVAVARKLAVLLHHLWATGEVYEPFPEIPGRRAA